MDYTEALDKTSYELLRMNKKQVLEVARALSKEANNRRNLLKESGLYKYSPAYQATIKGPYKTGKFTANNNMTRNKLLSEIKRSRGFLKAKTSTVSGAMEHKESIIEMLEISDDNTKIIDRTFSIVDRMRDIGLYDFYNNIMGSERVITVVREQVQSSSKNTTILNMIKRIEKELRAVQEERNLEIERIEERFRDVNPFEY